MPTGAAGEIAVRPNVDRLQGGHGNSSCHLLPGDNLGLTRRSRRRVMESLSEDDTHKGECSTLPFPFASQVL